VDNPESFLDETEALNFAQQVVIGSSDERREKLNRFARGLRELNERWDNRFLPERENLCEAYIKGRFEVAINGCLTGTVVERHWLLRIKPTVPELDARLPIDNQINLAHGSALRSYDQLIVLVDTVK
jgi:hypothetical protein